MAIHLDSLHKEAWWNGQTVFKRPRTHPHTRTLRVPHRSVSSLEHFSCQNQDDTPTLQVTGEERGSSLSAFNTNDEMRTQKTMDDGTMRTGYYSPPNWLLSAFKMWREINKFHRLSAMYCSHTEASQSFCPFKNAYAIEFFMRKSKNKKLKREQMRPGKWGSA